WAAVAGLTLAFPRLLALQSPEALAREVARRTQELRDKEARLRAIVETAEYGILTLDDGWAVRSANPVCERLFGVPSERMVGTRFESWVRATESGDFLSDQVGTGEGKVFGLGGDVLGVRGDGSTFPASLSVSNTHLASGRMYTVILTDLTSL